MKKTYYYHSFDEDIVKNVGQDYKLPPDYKWIQHGKLQTVLSGILYAVVKLMARIYCRFFMRVQFRGRETVNACRGRGCFVYANHTQPFGDVILPAIAADRHRVFVVASPANLGIPVIGKILPGLGAIPVPDDRKRMKEFVEAIKTRIDSGHCVFIYPEAHVWPYYTEIRPFSTSSFHYPIEMDAPVFCMTMTYQKGSSGHPKATCYIDRCEIPSEDGISRRQKIRMLRNAVYDCMKMRSSRSNYQYCKYIKADEEEKR